MTADYLSFLVCLRPTGTTHLYINGRSVGEVRLDTLVVPSPTNPTYIRELAAAMPFGSVAALKDALHMAIDAMDIREDRVTP